MSAATSKASPPAALTMASVSSALRSGRRLTQTSAPSEASLTEMAWPWPWVAPVTIATLPAKRRSISLSCVEWAGSEHGDRVPRAARGTRQAQRQADHQKLPALFLETGLVNLLELQAVGDQHAHGCQLEWMDGVGHSFDIARHRLAVAIGQEGRDLAFMHPGHRIDMETSLALTARRVVVAPRAESQPTRMMAGTEDEDVAFAEADALRFLDLLQLGTGDRLARLEPFELAVMSGIQHHAAADDALVVGGDAPPFRAARCEERGRLPIVELALPGDVVQRIDMGMGIAVAGHAEVAHAEGKAALADRYVVHQRHEMHGRVRVVGSGLLVDRDRHRDAAALVHQPGRRGDLVRRDVVERTEFVVRSPFAPILDLLEHRLEGGEGHRGGCGQLSGHGEPPLDRAQSGVLAPEAGGETQVPEPHFVHAAVAVLTARASGRICGTRG